MRPGFGQDRSSRGPWDATQETLYWTLKSLALCLIEKEAMDPEKVLEIVLGRLIFWGFYPAECVDLVKYSKG